jgi:hypothetical protein
MAIICPYLVYNADNKHKSQDNCLQSTREYLTAALHHRVLSCRSYIKHNGTVRYTDYTLDHDRATLFKRVLCVPERRCHYYAIIPPDQHVLFYADVDMKNPPPGMTPDRLLDAVLEVIER